MARPLRISYEGAVHHLTNRGNNRDRIFYTAKDRQYFLQLLDEVAKRYQWICYAYCLILKRNCSAFGCSLCHG